MDTELARTFLAVAATGNFVAAASRLHVTQSTVSARIHTLETTLSARLFHRGRNGAELTPSGKRFLRHAKHLVRTLEQAIHDVGLPQGFRDVLTLSGRLALWEGFLPHWVDWMHKAAPDISLRLEIGFESDIMELLLVASEPTEGWSDEGYIHIDWGPEFHAKFSDHHPDAPPPTLVANIGWLGVQQLLTYGGSGYFPKRLVRHYLEDGLLWQVPDSPQFKLPAYMVFPHDSESDSTTLKQALDGLRELAQAEQSRY
ncbi:MAG: LysR family transcriptional regulator [Thiobacillus sp.]|nr:LysR family transcriptional regulator [Thiobacillus sp.]